MKNYKSKPESGNWPLSSGKGSGDELYSYKQEIQ